jgi:tungstate transport system permease protein
VATLLWDARYSLLTAALAGLGRALAEVGAVLIVGGNINHVTRTMTTAIALETSRGELALALGLGFILIALSVIVSAALMGLRTSAARMAYA